MGDRIPPLLSLCGSQYGPKFEGGGRLSIINEDCLFKKDSIEIKREEEVRVKVRKMKGKVTLAERPSQWKPLDVTKVPRMWMTLVTCERPSTPSVLLKDANAHPTPLGKRDQL